MLIHRFYQAPGAFAYVPGAPVCQALPVVTGDAVEDETLTCDEGDWIGDATITFAFQWYQAAGGGEEPPPAGDVLTDEDGAALLDENGEELTTTSVLEFAASFLDGLAGQLLGWNKRAANDCRSMALHLRSRDRSSLSTKRN